MILSDPAGEDQKIKTTLVNHQGGFFQGEEDDYNVITEFWLSPKPLGQ